MRNLVDFTPEPLIFLVIFGHFPQVSKEKNMVNLFGNFQGDDHQRSRQRFLLRKWINQMFVNEKGRKS